MITPPEDYQARRFQVLRIDSASRMLAQGVAEACVALTAIRVRVGGGFPFVEARYPWIATYAL